MLHCRYCVIKIDGQTAVLTEVQRNVFTSTHTKVAVTNFLRNILKNRTLAVILLSYDGQGNPLFYGPQLIIAKLKTARLANLTWYNITIN